MADLLVEAVGRQDAYSDVRAIPCEIIGLTTLAQIGGDPPGIRGGPLPLDGPPTDMGTDESFRVAADAVDGAARPLQMLGWAIDPLVISDIHDVAVGSAGP